MFPPPTKKYVKNLTHMQSFSGSPILFILLTIAFLIGVITQFAVALRTLWSYKLIQNQCAKCRYPLDGLAPAQRTCPECGRILTPFDHSLRPSWRRLTHRLPGLTHPLYLWLISAILLVASGFFIIKPAYLTGEFSYVYEFDLNTSNGPLNVTIHRRWRHNELALSLFNHAIWSRVDPYTPQNAWPSWLQTMRSKPPSKIFRIEPDLTLALGGTPGEFSAPWTLDSKSQDEMDKLAAGKPVNYHSPISAQLLQQFIDKQWATTLDPGQADALNTLLTNFLAPGVTALLAAPPEPNLPVVHSYPNLSANTSLNPKQIQLNILTLAALSILTFPALLFIRRRLKRIQLSP